MWDDFVFPLHRGNLAFCPVSTYTLACTISNVNGERLLNGASTWQMFTNKSNVSNLPASLALSFIQ